MTSDVGRARRAGVLVLALLALLSSAALLVRGSRIARSRLGQDEITRYLARFEGLRRALPAHGTVGYESDLQDSLTDRQEVKGFYLTQYAIAPVVVVAGTDRDLVIGNYRDPALNCRICRSTSFVLEKDFGGGVLLFRRISR